MAYAADSTDYSFSDPGTDSGSGDSSQQNVPWWQGPRPAGLPDWAPWPPPLPPGASYDPNTPGQINYPTPPSGAPPPPANPTGDPNSGSYWDPTANNGAGGWTNNPFPSGGGAQPSPGVSPAGGGGGSGSSGSGAGNSPTPFNWPQFNPPPYTPGTPLGAPPPYTFTPFSYKDFTAPTLAEAQNQPGYQFGLQQGQGALLNTAAQLGVARGGGTLKNLFDYTNAAAEQNYGNVYNQDLGTYTTNRDTAFNSWAADQAASLAAYNTNWGVQQQVNNSLNAVNQQNYTNAFQNAAAQFNPQFSAAQSTFSDMYNRWLAKLNALTTIAGQGAG